MDCLKKDNYIDIHGMNNKYGIFIYFKLKNIRKLKYKQFSDILKFYKIIILILQSQML